MQYIQYIYHLVETSGVQTWLYDGEEEESEDSSSGTKLIPTKPMIRFLSNLAGMLIKIFITKYK